MKLKYLKKLQPSNTNFLKCIPLLKKIKEQPSNPVMYQLRYLLQEKDIVCFKSNGFYGSNRSFIKVGAYIFIREDRKYSLLQLLNIYTCNVDNLILVGYLYSYYGEDASISCPYYMKKNNTKKYFKVGPTNKVLFQASISQCKLALSAIYLNTWIRNPVIVDTTEYKIWQDSLNH